MTTAIKTSLEKSEKVSLKEQKTDGGTPEATLEERRQRVIKKVREYARITFDTLHIASRHETEMLVRGTDHITEKDIDGWEQYVDGLMQEQIASARALYNDLMDPLLAALHDKTISERVVSKLYADFSSAETGYKEKEWYVKTVFPKRLEEWKRVKAERDELVQKKGIRSLKDAGIEHFEKLFDPAMFADLKWNERKKLVEEATAHLHARENGAEHLMPEIEATLVSFTKEGILHPSKVATWMKRIFVKNATQKDIATFMEKTVLPYADHWRATRKDFDDLHAQMGKNVPRGFQKLSADAFLRKEYKQRTSYCDLLRLRLENVHEQDKALASARLRIRHNLDTQDWEGAEEDLAAALKQWPDNLELQSMNTYLQHHRPEEAEHAEAKNASDPHAILKNLRHMLTLIPGNLRTLYVQALKDGPAVLHRLQQIIGNAAWAAEHGYTSEDEKLRNIQDEQNKEKTAYYAKHGHAKGLAHNLLIGETAIAESINDDCTEPQYLYLSSIGKSAVMEKVRQHKDNEQFGYWTILCDADTSLDKQISVSKNLHYPMKTALRQLARMGYRFTTAGSPQRKGGVSAPADAHRFTMMS